MVLASSDNVVLQVTSFRCLHDYVSLLAVALHFYGYLHRLAGVLNRHLTRFISVTA